MINYKILPDVPMKRPQGDIRALYVDPRCNSIVVRICPLRSHTIRSFNLLHVMIYFPVHAISIPTTSSVCR